MCRAVCSFYIAHLKLSARFVHAGEEQNKVSRQSMCNSFSMPARPRALLQAVWPAGFHMGMPWRLKVSNLVTKQNVVFDLPVKGCTTRDNVTVEIDVAIVFRIMGDKDRVRNETNKSTSALSQGTLTHFHYRTTKRKWSPAKRLCRIRASRGD